MYIFFIIIAVGLFLWSGYKLFLAKYWVGNKPEGYPDPRSLHKDTLAQPKKKSRFQTRLDEAMRVAAEAKLTHYNVPISNDIEISLKMLRRECEAKGKTLLWTKMSQGGYDYLLAAYLCKGKATIQEVRDKSVEYDCLTCHREIDFPRRIRESLMETHLNN